MLELMVAMSITVILLGMVMYMTSMSMTTYQESRGQVRSTRLAKEALDAIAKDFEGMVARSDGSSTMWLYAEVEPELTGDIATDESLVGPANKKITNASRLIFFTGAADRYDGDIGGTGDNGGDVSAVGYRLVYRDQISGAASDAVGDFPTFTLYRHIVDPDVTFINVLGQDDLTNPQSPPAPAPAVVNQFTDALDFVAENVLVENIYELTVTFLVQYTTAGGATMIERVTIGQTAGDQYATFAIKGNGIVATGGSNAALITDGQLVGVEISITVLSDKGLVMTQKGGMSRGEIIEEHAYRYSKTISVPRL